MPHNWSQGTHVIKLGDAGYMAGAARLAGLVTNTVRYSYDTMEDLIADGAYWETFCAGGAARLVTIGGGREVGDGGKCEVYITKSTGTEGFQNTGFCWVGPKGEVGIGASRGAKITWPEGVINGVALGMKSTEWTTATTDVPARAESAASVDALFLKCGLMMDDQTGLTFRIPQGEYHHYEEFKIDDASYCVVEGDGVGRTIIKAGRFYEADGTTVKYDNDSGAQNDNIPMIARFQFLRGQYNTFRRLDYRGEFMCNRIFWMRSGFGLIEDSYGEKCGGRPFACGNEDGEDTEHNGQLFNQNMRNLEARQAIGTAFSARGVKRYKAENLRAFECCAEGITADDCAEAIIESCQLNDVCRQDRGASYVQPVANLWADLGGVGGVGAIAPSENSTLTGVHNCRINGVSNDRPTGTRSKPGIRWRAKQDNASGISITGNVFKDMGVGISLDDFYQSEDLTTYVCRNATISGNTFIDVGVADGQGQGHVQVDSGARNVTIVGNGADTSFKVFGYSGKNAGTPDGTLVDGTWHLDPSIIIANNGRDGVSPVTTLSGTGVTLNAPRGCRRAVVDIVGASLAGANDILIRIADTSIATTSYTSTCETAAAGAAASTAGFLVNVGNAALTFTGRIVLNLHDPANHIWTADVQGRTSTPAMVIGYGTRTLAGPLTQIRVTASGSDTYDAGTVRIVWE